MNIYNDNWLGKTLNVVKSNDATLIDKQGTVIDETKRTITIKSQDKLVKLGKSSIKFTYPTAMS